MFYEVSENQGRGGLYNVRANLKTNRQTHNQWQPIPQTKQHFWKRWKNVNVDFNIASTGNKVVNKFSKRHT